MKIIIETIEHIEQRYSTVGDWIIENSEPGNQVIRIKVSKMSDWRSEFLVAVHELVEIGLCIQAGISQKQVDDFDMNFKGEGEPGDDPNAPYNEQHSLALAIERILSGYLGLDWFKHDEAVEALP